MFARCDVIVSTPVLANPKMTGEHIQEMKESSAHLHCFRHLLEVRVEMFVALEDVPMLVEGAKYTPERCKTEGMGIGT